MHKPQTTPVCADSIAAPAGKSIYPAPFRAMVQGRSKTKLGEIFGLSNFGVNLTSLKPGSASALKHYHLKQDEFIYVLSGAATLVLGDDQVLMKAGDCVGFKAGVQLGHQIRNDGEEIVSYLEIGDRTAGDEVCYPDDDLMAKMTDVGWQFLHKDGSPWA